MKIFLKLLMGLVVLAVIAPFYLKNQQGGQLMSLSDIKMPTLSTPAVPEIVKSTLSDISTNIPSSSSDDSTEEKTQIKVHKWRDKDGTWHFSNIDDSHNGTNSKVIFIDSAENTATPIKKPQPEATSTKTNSVENITPSLLLPLTHGKATLDQARQIQGMLEQRHKTQQQMMQ
jgi:hypothetical protein